VVGWVFFGIITQEWRFYRILNIIDLIVTICDGDLWRLTCVVRHKLASDTRLAIC
jgi:hypothetical protein